MVISIILLIISFLLESFMSIYFPAYYISPSIFTTLYTLITLVVIYPYFSNEKKYYLLLTTFAILLDIVYTSTILLNIVGFFIISLIIKILNNIISYNVFTSCLVSIISVISYHILSFIILTILNINSYSLSNLFTIIYSSILGTIIYSIIVYLVSKILFKKYDLVSIK